MDVIPSTSLLGKLWDSRGGGRCRALKEQGVNLVRLASVCPPELLLPTHPFPTYWMEGNERMNPMKTAS
jgi:hypothetical protein